MMMAFAVKDGVASMRFETHDSASMLFRQCHDFADNPVSNRYEILTKSYFTSVGNPSIRTQLGVIEGLL